MSQLIENHADSDADAFLNEQKQNKLMNKFFFDKTEVEFKSVVFRSQSNVCMKDHQICIDQNIVWTANLSEEPRMKRFVLI